METTTINVIIVGIVGLITGAIGSLIAPWVQWGVEKKRIKHERRAALIKRWRKTLSNKNFQRGDILNDPDYGPLKKLLTDQARQEIERSSDHIMVYLNSPTQNSDKDLILREVARIEKSWGLI